MPSMPPVTDDHNRHFLKNIFTFIDNGSHTFKQTEGYSGKIRILTSYVAFTFYFQGDLNRHLHIWCLRNINLD